ncbi:MAG: hypothetical protein IJC56_11685 [Clostridia bacterium]|nr:hypothetical protein [Clostridia bacterium]
MKKIAIILIVALLTAFTAFAEAPETEPVLLEGVVTSITEEGYMVYESTLGEVMVFVNEETIVEATSDITVGDYIYADYSGQMTFSIPPQITATVLRMYKLEGDIVEIMAEDNSVMLNTMDYGDVIVHLPEEWAGQEITETHMTAYYNGMIMTSLPGQISAGLVIPGYSVSGIITEIAEDHIIIGEELSSYHINITPEQLTEEIAEGAAVRVFFDGMMTRSLPPQVTALTISPIVTITETAE